MSLETLLDTLAEPPVPPGEGVEEPLETASAKAGSPGSPSSPEKTSAHDETLATATCGLPTTPTKARDATAPENIEDWRKSDINTETLTAFARSLAQRREMDQGKVPAHFTEHATCKRCGPVWLWFSGEVLGCPWCWNRAADRPIPRPQPVCCGDCIHFERVDHPHLGHCAKGELEAIAGLWDTDRKECPRWHPLSSNSGDLVNGQ